MPQFDMILIEEDDAKGADILKHEAGKPFRLIRRRHGFELVDEQSGGNGS